MTDVFNDGDIVDMSSDVHEYSSFVNLRSLERKVTGILLGPEIKTDSSLCTGSGPIGVKLLFRPFAVCWIGVRKVTGALKV